MNPAQDRPGSLFVCENTVEHMISLFVIEKHCNVCQTKFQLIFFGMIDIALVCFLIGVVI